MLLKNKTLSSSQNNFQSWINSKLIEGPVVYSTCICTWIGI